MCYRIYGCVYVKYSVCDREDIEDDDSVIKSKGIDQSSVDQSHWRDLENLSKESLSLLNCILMRLNKLWCILEP